MKKKKEDKRRIKLIKIIIMIIGRIVCGRRINLLL
jgi:hypothetical protein